MVSAQTRSAFVAKENRFTLFRIMLRCDGRAACDRQGPADTDRQPGRYGEHGMKTDDLVEVLSARAAPVDFREVGRRIALAAASGLIVAVVAILIGLGLRSGLATAGAWAFLCVKIAFAAAIVGSAAVYLSRLSRPGSVPWHGIRFVILPFLAIVGLALASLGSAPMSHWHRMVEGDAWLECLVSIPVIAIVPFALTMWAVRQAAPPTCAAPARSPASSLAASAQSPTRFTAPTTRCRLSRSGTAARS